MLRRGGGVASSAQGIPLAEAFRQHDFLDVRRAACQHEQAIHAEGDTGAVRQAMREGGEEVFIKRDLRQPRLHAGAIVGKEAGALFGGVCQFPEAVAQFHAVDIELEAGGDRFGIDIHHADDAAIRRLATAHIPESAAWPLTRDAMLDLLYSHYIEPQLGRGALEYICDYPPSQAALARISENADGEAVAARFELYIDGMELCNGFWELTDAAEQRARFLADNRTRAQMGLPPIPLDEDFLAALAHGLPDCAGVALGVDRLLMLASGATHIEDVVPPSRL